VLLELIIGGQQYLGVVLGALVCCSAWERHSRGGDDLPRACVRVLVASGSVRRAGARVRMAAGGRQRRACPPDTAAARAGHGLPAGNVALTDRSGFPGGDPDAPEAAVISGNRTRRALPNPVMQLGLLGGGNCGLACLWAAGPSMAPRIERGARRGQPTGLPYRGGRRHRRRPRGRDRFRAGGTGRDPVATRAMIAANGAGTTDPSPRHHFRRSPPTGIPAA
jgi:hypothetical protein